MPRVLRVAACAALLSFVALSASAQYPAPKPTTPGEIAAMDRAKAEKRAACEREGRAHKLGYFKRREYVRNCTRR